MYVMEFTNNTGAAIRVGGTSGFNLNANTSCLIPAERCVWDILPIAGGSNGYSMNDVVYYPPVGDPETLSGSNRDIRFGYIGKTGRFVEMAR